MAKLPQYVLDKNLLHQLPNAMQEASLDVQQFGPPHATEQGPEQIWICSDKLGQLFSFSTIEVNDMNVFGLKSGDLYLVLGPREKSARKRTRKDEVEAFERFERSLTALGAKRMQ